MAHVLVEFTAGYRGLSFPECAISERDERQLPHEARALLQQWHRSVIDHLFQTYRLRLSRLPGDADVYIRRRRDTITVSLLDPHGCGHFSLSQHRLTLWLRPSHPFRFEAPQGRISIERFCDAVAAWAATGNIAPVPKQAGTVAKAPSQRGTAGVAEAPRSSGGQGSSKVDRDQQLQALANRFAKEFPKLVQTDHVDEEMHSLPDEPLVPTVPTVPESEIEDMRRTYSALWRAYDRDFAQPDTSATPANREPTETVPSTPGSEDDDMRDWFARLERARRSSNASVTPANREPTETVPSTPRSEDDDMQDFFARLERARRSSYASATPDNRVPTGNEDPDAEAPWLRGPNGEEIYDVSPPGEPDSDSSTSEQASPRTPRSASPTSSTPKTSPPSSNPVASPPVHRIDDTDSDSDDASRTLTEGSEFESGDSDDSHPAEEPVIHSGGRTIVIQVNFDDHGFTDEAFALFKQDYLYTNWKKYGALRGCHLLQCLDLDADYCCSRGGYWGRTIVTVLPVWAPHYSSDDWNRYEEVYRLDHAYRYKYDLWVVGDDAQADGGVHEDEYRDMTAAERLQGDGTSAEEVAEFQKWHRELDESGRTWHGYTRTW